MVTFNNYYVCFDNIKNKITPITKAELTELNSSVADGASRQKKVIE